MRIPVELINCLVYLYDNDELLGSGFFVRVPDGPDGSGINYIVTASHVVNGGPAPIIRVNNVANDAVKIPTRAENWWYPASSSIDLAIAVFPDQVDVRPTIIWQRQIADDAFLVEKDVGPGDEVLVTGLFQGSPGTERNLPVARFGQIARMNDERVPMEAPNGTSRDVDAIMVEAHSWGGLSGSPAFVLFPVTRWMGFLELPALPTQDTRLMWALLGVNIGHWNLPSPIRLRNQPRTRDPEREGMINAGIALVTSGQHIIDLLMREDVVMDREARTEAKRERSPAATADAVEQSPERE